MRLIQFHIKNYRIIKNLNVDFERPSKQVDLQQGYTLDFLVGVNGTGKTTVLRLLGLLFQTLEKGTRSFDEHIRLIYQIGSTNKRVEITNISDEGELQSKVLRYRIDNGDWQEGIKIPDEFFPRHVIAYTTGNEEAWLKELSFVDLTEQDANSEISYDDKSELPGHKLSLLNDEKGSKSSKKFLFITSNRLPLITLCGLLASRKWKQEREGDEVLEDVLDALDIHSLVAFSLRIRGNVDITEPTKWRFIEELRDISTSCVQQGSDMLMVFDMSKSQLTLNRFGNGFVEFFQKLSALYDSDPYHNPELQEVNLFLKRNPPTQQSNGESLKDTKEAHNHQLLLYDWLSDGEQSFLGRMALFALFRQADALILLDEPEVHFNDAWKREIVRKLDKVMTGHSSHILITTHSSIALTDVSKEDILILSRNSEKVGIPLIETLGADPSDIIVHVFGAHSPTGERSIRFILDQLYSPKRKKGNLTDLLDSVAPGYWRYRIHQEIQRLPDLGITS